MNEQRINTLQVIKAAEQVANNKIKELEKSFIEWLENRKDAVFGEDEDLLVKDILKIAYSREGIQMKGEEKIEFNKVAYHVKALMYEKLTEIIEELRKTLEARKKGGFFQGSNFS